VFYFWQQIKHGAATNFGGAYVHRKFPGRLISNKSDIPWPPYSPDLTPPDFFLWGYIKEEVFKQTVIELKTEIRRAITAINVDTLRRVIVNCAMRMWTVRAYAVMQI